jgi:SAM-dependent methyltransferase/uncharacterized protein YbaR (Trm112 family)
MKERILSVLACPACDSDFTLKNLIRVKGEVKQGLLQCEQGHAYAIRNFIPNLIKDEQVRLKAKIQVKNSFSKKWTSWQKFNPWYVQFFDDWFRRKVGIASKKEFSKYFKNMRYMLDAGTGIGPKVETMCRLSPGEVFGIDVSDSVEAAYRNTRRFPNAHIIKADLFAPPFKKNLFDFIICDGVIHHTPDPRKGFSVLSRYLAQQGIFSLHVYKKMGPIREFTDDFIRAYSAGLDFKQCYRFCSDFTKFGRALAQSKIKINIPANIPLLQIKKGKYDLQRFIYYNLFQCFWNENLSFKENNLVNLDWFHPVCASRHTEQEISGWFKAAKLKQIKSFKANDSGVSMRGVKR